jgi:SAM-dependent methyltransferase
MKSDLPALFSDSLRDATCLLLVLSGKRAGSNDPVEKVTIRPVELRGKQNYQLAFKQGKRETHENLSPAKAVERVGALFGATFENAHLFTPDGDYEARLVEGSVRVNQGPPTKAIVAREHNRTKQYLIPENVPCPFLIEIGVMTPAGKVHAAKYSKFRQINRFLELIDDVVEFLPADRELRVVDFGSGKSYLTFALYHLLTVVHGRRVQMTGVDREQNVVAKCADIARRLGYNSLSFQCGDIASFESPEKVDLAVSLHACDTATDDALAQAVRSQAEVILAVPCCQHELADKIQSESLQPLAKHGILHERLAALVTDSLRAQALEICGYRTQVVEFIDMEHTAKNVLIRAVHRGDATQRDRAVGDYERLKTEFGLGRIYLDEVFGESLRPNLSRENDANVIS